MEEHLQHAIKQAYRVTSLSAKEEWLNRALKLIEEIRKAERNESA